jgi:hypothetical protein
MDMKAALLSPVLVAVGVAIAAPSFAQGYNDYGRDQRDRGYWQDQYDRNQQAQLPDRRDYCTDLRRRDDRARYDVDHAQFREDWQRAQDRVRNLDDQLWRNCS